MSKGPQRAVREGRIHSFKARCQYFSTVLGDVAVEGFYAATKDEPFAAPGGGSLFQDFEAKWMHGLSTALDLMALDSTYADQRAPRLARAVYKFLSSPCLPELWHIFQRVAENPSTMPEALERWDPPGLADRAAAGPNQKVLPTRLVTPTYMASLLSDLTLHFGEMISALRAAHWKREGDETDMRDWLTGLLTIIKTNAGLLADQNSFRLGARASPNHPRALQDPLSHFLKTVEMKLAAIEPFQGSAVSTNLPVAPTPRDLTAEPEEEPMLSQPSSAARTYEPVPSSAARTYEPMLSQPMLSQPSSARSYDPALSQRSDMAMSQRSDMPMIQRSDMPSASQPMSQPTGKLKLSRVISESTDVPPSIASSIQRDPESCRRRRMPDSPPPSMRSASSLAGLPAMLSGAVSRQISQRGSHRPSLQSSVSRYKARPKGRRDDRRKAQPSRPASRHDRAATSEAAYIAASEVYAGMKFGIRQGFGSRWQGFCPAQLRQLHLFPDAHKRLEHFRLQCQKKVMVLGNITDLTESTIHATWKLSNAVFRHCIKELAPAYDLDRCTTFWCNGRSFEVSARQRVLCGVAAAIIIAVKNQEEQVFGKHWIHKMTRDPRGIRSVFYDDAHTEAYTHYFDKYCQALNSYESDPNGSTTVPKLTDFDEMREYYSEVIVPWMTSELVNPLEFLQYQIERCDMSDTSTLYRFSCFFLARCYLTPAEDLWRLEREIVGNASITEITAAAILAACHVLLRHGHFSDAEVERLRKVPLIQWPPNRPAASVCKEYHKLFADCFSLNAMEPDVINALGERYELNGLLGGTLRGYDLNGHAWH